VYVPTYGFALHRLTPPQILIYFNNQGRARHSAYTVLPPSSNKV
jgi:hypothetical protein